MTIAIVLAAGAGTRFVGEVPKLLAPFRGRPLVRWALDAALGAGLSHTVVVTGAIDLSEEIHPPLVALHNDAWSTGMASSIWTGLSYAEAQGADAVVVGLGDQPLVSASAWRAVAKSPHPIAVASFAGERRPPTRLSREVWDLMPRTGDVGAHAIMQVRPELVVEVACEGEPIDVDTKEDLSTWT